jgi:3-oxoacyl-[acyl-carrier protein] reductase
MEYSGAMELAGRSAVVTGAASGIGRATAQALARAGVRGIALADVDARGLAQTAELVQGAGATALPVPTDVTQADALEHLFERAHTAFGALHLVHNNAGMTSGDPPWPDTPVARLQSVVAVNLAAVMIGTRLALPRIRSSGGGAIVNTASMAAHAPLPPDAAYAATKAGVVLFTRSCAPLRESHGVRVNCVCPGVVETPLLYTTTNGGRLASWLAPVYDAVEPLTPDEIAEAVLSLMRDEAQAGVALDVPNRPRAKSAKG